MSQDLIGVWECSLTQSDIFSSAKAQNASIDPSESSAQLQVLLQKLEQGIQSSQNALYREKIKDSEILFLRTRCELPRPLQPLIWNFQLLPQAAHDLSEQLLRPCLFEASISQQKIKSLEQIIKEKDHVISRLLEKLEGSNTDLGLIFPGVKSRRGRVTAAEAEKHVPGMAAFQKASWASHFDTDSPYASYATSGIDNLVSGCQKCPDHTAREHADWIRHLPDSATVNVENRESQGSKTETVQKKSVTPTESNSRSDDEFERQQTPPHLKSSKANSEPHKEGGKKRRLPSQSSSSPDGTMTQSTKVTSIKHAKQPNASASVSERRDRIRKSPVYTQHSDSETASEEVEEDDLDAPTHNLRHQKSPSTCSRSDNETNHQSTEKRPKLGGLRNGGKQKDTSTSESGDQASRSARRLGGLKKSSDQSESSRYKSDNPSPPRRLGGLGKMQTHRSQQDNNPSANAKGDGDQEEPNKDDSDATATASATPSRSPSPTPEEPSHKATDKEKPQRHDLTTHIKPDPETVQDVILNAEPQVEMTAEEKANKRREELKRKVDSGPATRKKRRF